MRFLLLIGSILTLTACGGQDPYEKDANALIEELSQETKAMTFDEKVDYLRSTVHTATFHQSTGQEAEVTSVTMGLAAIYRGRHGLPRIHFRCSQRSHFLGEILSRAFNTKSRITNVYSDDYDDLQGHTVLEVYNSDHAQWQVSDTDYNLHWENLNGERLDMRQIVMTAYTDIVPCSDLGCSWDLTPSQEDSSPMLLRDRNFLSAMQFLYEKEMIINSSRFDIHKRFRNKGGKTIIELFSDQDIEIDPHSLFWPQ